jgi:3-oxoacyl-[acyl-carrier-protein] synthase II
MKLAIKGIGVVGGFGCGMESLTTAISNGGSPVQHVSVKTSSGPCDMPAFLAETSKLDDFVNKRALRRVDHYSRMALLGAHFALEDAGKLAEQHSTMGIIIASGYGAGRTTFAFLDSFINDGDNLSSPTFFSNSVQNAAVANVSMMLGITGPGLTVSQFDMSVPSALITARHWLEEGRVDSVLFGTVDEYCDVMGYCWYRYYGDKATADHEIKPFEYDHQTAIPGEGAAFFLLTRADDSASRYGYIENVMMGRYDRSPLTITDDTLLFISADGHKQCGSYYKKYIPENNRLASYTPVYGSLPIGTAFDMAIAALSIKGGTLCNPPSGNIPVSDRNMSDKHIACLKIDNEGRFGVITLGNNLQTKGK